MSLYKVLDFNETSGQLIIQVAQELAPLAIDIPLKDGLYITGDELDNYIKGFIPVEFIERQLKINQGVANASELRALVQKTEVIEPPTIKPPEQIQADANAEMWRQLNFERDVVKVLVKFGVLQSDPTSIPVSEQ
jgi:hypothetical protein